jgi:hypothetical protein
MQQQQQQQQHRVHALALSFHRPATTAASPAHATRPRSEKSSQELLQLLSDVFSLISPKHQVGMLPNRCAHSTPHRPRARRMGCVQQQPCSALTIVRLGGPRPCAEN